MDVINYLISVAIFNRLSYSRGAQPFNYLNPHCRLYFNLRQPGGQTENFSLSKNENLLLKNRLVKLVNLSNIFVQIEVFL